MSRFAREDIDWRSCDVCGALSEGDLLALSFLYSILSLNNFTAKDLFLLQDLDDMNIRGKQICIAFTEYCDSDTGCFRQCIENRDKGMIDKINEICLSHNYLHKAVTRGASSDTREFLPHIEE